MEFVYDKGFLAVGSALVWRGGRSMGDGRFRNRGREGWGGGLIY